jgi:hypothetical protein
MVFSGIRDNRVGLWAGGPRALEIQIFNTLFPDTVSAPPHTEGSLGTRIELASSMSPVRITWITI